VGIDARGEWTTLFGREAVDGVESLHHGRMFDRLKWRLAKGEEPALLRLPMASRHGLVAGATGTGKTVTLQVLAEGFANAGVPVFAADIKGDLSGIAANGDAANKIGTYGLAVIAKMHHIPFFVAAPLSTIDFSLRDGTLIPIEERDPQEIYQVGETRLCPEGVDFYNPAFDVTPAELITAIITEKGAVPPDQLGTIRG
jgi:hypothetical protein